MVKHNKNFGKPLDPEHKKRISDALKGNTNKKGTHHSEETKAKIRDAHLGLKHTEETKAIIKMKRASQVCSEETRKKMSESRTGARNPNYGKKISEARRQYLSEINSGHNNPVFGKGGTMLGKNHSEETKQKMRETQLISQNRPEVKQHKSELFSGEKNPNWNGGDKEYCEKWTPDLRRRIRAFWGDACGACGAVQAKPLLSCHHVYYNKKACCVVAENGKYYSNLNLLNHPFDFEIVGDPNKFIPLCKKCHDKTTALKNRVMFAREFERKINETYNGKSYLTTEEYVAKILGR